MNALMRAGVIKVVDIDLYHSRELAVEQDEQVVQTFSPHIAKESFTNPSMVASRNCWATQFSVG